VGALLSYGIFFTLFFLKSLLTGNFIAPSDSLDFGVAAYLSSPSLWTQGMYSGYPIAADPQSLTWYPVLHLLRGLGLGWNGFLISAYVIASTTAFLFVRRLTTSTAAGVFSGFVYGFSGVILGHIGHFNQIHAAAWVPLALYGFHLIREGEYRPGGLVAAAAFALAHYLMPRTLALVARSGVRELFVIGAVFFCLGAATLTTALGLSAALGAFLAGILISESEYSHHIAAEIIPFRDLFSSLFFIGIGMLLDPGFVAAHARIVARLQQDPAIRAELRA